jgi:hypothetical protein
VADASGASLKIFMLSLTPLRRVVKDYFGICDSYYAALRTATPAQIEAIDMGRRGLHNEGSELLRERLAVLELPAPVHTLRLECERTVRLPGTHGELFPAAGTDAEGLGRLVERLHFSVVGLRCPW